MELPNLPQVAWMLWCLWIIGVGFYRVGGRLWTQLDGAVISSRDIAPTRGPDYATEYTLRGSDGRETLYVAGATDISLPRSMPIGTTLHKKRWHLDYERNGQRVDDFRLPNYLVALSVGFGGLGWSFVKWRKSRLKELKWLRPDEPVSGPAARGRKVIYR